jgi:hypothetical protein
VAQNVRPFPNYTALQPRKIYSSVTTMRIKNPTITGIYRLDRYIVGCMDGSFSTSVDGWIGSDGQTQREEYIYIYYVCVKAYGGVDV